MQETSPLLIFHLLEGGPPDHTCVQLGPAAETLIASGAHEGRVSRKKKKHTEASATLTLIPSNVSVQAPGVMIVFMRLWRVCDWFHKSLYAGESVGDDDVQACVWAYPRLLCVCFYVSE